MWSGTLREPVWGTTGQRWEEGGLSIPSNHWWNTGGFSILRSIQDSSGCFQMRGAIWDLHKRCPCFRQWVGFFFALPQQIGISLEITKQVLTQAQKEKKGVGVGNLEARFSEIKAYCPGLSQVISWDEETKTKMSALGRWGNGSDICFFASLGFGVKCFDEHTQQQDECRIKKAHLPLCSEQSLTCGPLALPGAGGGAHGCSPSRANPTLPPWSVTAFSFMST